MLAAPLILAGLLAPSVAPARAPMDARALTKIVTDLVQKEDTATLTDNRAALQSLFLPDAASAQAAYEKALQRLTYMADWARARRIQFDGVTVHVRIGPIHWLSADEVRVHGADQARYGYHHLTGNGAKTWFGLGVYHWYLLKRVHDRWYILGDTFIDPLNQDTRLKGPAVPAVIQVKPEHRAVEPVSAGARRALTYAAQYCGAAPGCAHDNRYHPRYPDFNWNGGDCSNFISQVLFAGGFSETAQWSCSDGEGTPAWVNAIRLAQYLERSGRATVYASGTLPTLLEKDAKGETPLDHLRLGDLIAYYEEGRIVHFAIVAGFDPDGYPLVISHSADRYREPWDLGWDRTTRFLLFHVHYPPRGAMRNQARPARTTSSVTARRTAST